MAASGCETSGVTGSDGAGEDDSGAGVLLEDGAGVLLDGAGVLLDEAWELEAGVEEEGVDGADDETTAEETSELVVEDELPGIALPGPYR